MSDTNKKSVVKNDHNNNGTAGVHTPLPLDAAADTSFKGYTLSEIRYRRALTALHREFCQEKMMSEVYALRGRLPFTSEGRDPQSAASRIGPYALKLLSGLNYVDYAILGLQVFGGVRKMFSFFKRKKK